MKKSCKYKKLDSKFEGKDEMAEIGSEIKSYKDKTLDLRWGNFNVCGNFLPVYFVEVHESIIYVNLSLRFTLI